MKKSPEIRLHSSDQELAELRPFWITHQTHPNSDFDHFLLVCRLSNYVLQPLVISVWEGRECKLVIAGRMENSSLSVRIGYLRLPRIRTRTLTVVYSGIIGEVDSERAALVFQKVNELLRDGMIEAVHFNMVPESNPFHTVAARFPDRTIPVSPEEWRVHRAMKIGAAPGFLLRGMRSKHRSWIGRKERELESEFGGRVNWSWHKDAIDVHRLCGEIESVAKATYQRGLGVGFKDDSLTRQRMSLFGDRGELRAKILEIDGKPRAFWVGQVYRGRFYSSATGHVTDLRRFEAGTLLFVRMTDDLASEGVRSLDFGFGDAQYKERFADDFSKEASIRFFGPSVRGRAIRRYVATAEAMSRMVESFAKDFGVASWVKRKWRERLRK